MVKMVKCKNCHYTDFRLPGTDCPICEIGELGTPEVYDHD
jgi:hypothetical protein